MQEKYGNKSSKLFGLHTISDFHVQCWCWGDDFDLKVYLAFVSLLLENKYLRLSATPYRENCLIYGQTMPQTMMPHMHS